jgi:hypothetical protein
MGGTVESTMKPKFGMAGKERPSTKGRGIPARHQLCVRCEQTIVRCVRTCGRGRKSVFIVFKQPCSLHVSLSSSANWLRNHEEGQIWCILVVSCSPQQMYALLQRK